ncbi:MAG: FkbM family methyltransferase [Spirochaetaceae bacterium]|nr:FkbM family methyltransferase [Spirochaetaceae bacterium]
MDVFICVVFEDTFFVFCFYNDNYDKSIVCALDPYMSEGPYGYKDGGFDVTVKKGGVVIDAGAWIGDFSAYAAFKGAEVYAFEPVSTTYETLLETAEMNGGKIHPHKMGLGAKEGSFEISLNEINSGSNSLINNAGSKKETVKITTLDAFVKENAIKKIDFIKADIEGAERDMLRGAEYVLKNHAPKLAICTYHLSDDPQVLENIILSINPNYKVVHLRKKLFAACAG